VAVRCGIPPPPMGAAGRGGVGVPIDGWAMGRGAADAAGVPATGVGAAAGFFAAAFFFGAARLAAGFFAATRLAGALRAAVLRAAAFLRAGAFFLALVFFAPDRAALARRVVLRALAFLLVVRFFPLVLVAMFLLRFLICCRRRPPAAGACMQNHSLHVQACRLARRVNCFFSLYADQSRK
jgi:hypothetical protein